MYNLELEKIAKEIKKLKVKRVLIQLPDGLKPKAEIITDYIEKNTNAKTFIWLGSCFGGCDLPPESDLKIMKIDLLVQFGHNKFIKTKW